MKKKPLIELTTTAQSFHDYLLSRTPDFDKQILKGMDPKSFFGKWEFKMPRGRREPDPLRAAIRKARREAKKNLTSTPSKA